MFKVVFNLYKTAKNNKTERKVQTIFPDKTDRRQEMIRLGGERNYKKGAETVYRPFRSEYLKT